MAAFGGVSYATNAVSHSVGVSNNNKGWSYTPSCDQYGQQGHKPGKPIYTPPRLRQGRKEGWIRRILRGIRLVGVSDAPPW